MSSDSQSEYKEILASLKIATKGLPKSKKVDAAFLYFLNMAKMSHPRPRISTSDSHERKVANLLCGVLRNLKFRDQIEEVNPLWFAKNRSQARKDRLILMAQNGEDLAAMVDKHAFRRYTTSGANYDDTLTNHLMALAPKWFHQPIKEDVKAILLEMARTGAPRPKRKTALHSSLTQYLNPRSERYDKAFTKEIRKINPDFIGRIGQKSSPGRKKQNQDELIKMAREGRPKPHYKSALGIALNNYMSQGSRVFDKSFREKIQSIRPDWIGVCYRFSRESRQEELLKMAASGAARPKFNEKNRAEMRLASRLNQYLKISPDMEFCSRLREIRPDWLPEELRSENKDQKKAG